MDAGVRPADAARRREVEREVGVGVAARFLFSRRG